MNIYCISGIAADHRMFTHINVPEGYKMIPLAWIAPLHGESLRDYALRLGKGIDTSQPFVLLGLSLGGIVCVEIARQQVPTCTIIISSIPRSSQLPGYFKLAGKLQLHHLVSPAVLKSASMINRYFAYESPQDKEMIRDTIQQGDNAFIKWAINAVMEWDNDQIPDQLWHIHGGKDEVFPIRYTKPTHVIPKGKHTMVISHGQEVSKIIGDILRQR